MKILIINGPNLDKLHLRNKELYSHLSLSEVEKLIRNEFPAIEFDFKHSNSESEIISLLHDAAENNNGVIINPGAFSHSSISIRDAIEISKIPVIEIHLSNLASREDFRHTMITASKSSGYISGFKEIGYLIAVYALIKLISHN